LSVKEGSVSANHYDRGTTGFFREGWMLRKARVAGWGLLALALVVTAIVVTVGALRAHGDLAFNHWVGWATVAALPIAAAGVVLVLWEKIVLGATSGEVGIDEIETDLAAVVLAQAQVARSRLIGADQADDQAANVRFVKGSGRFREVGGADKGDLTAVLTYYQSLSPGRMVVLGEPGAGKTVLALELLIRLLEHRQQDPSIPIPVLISAAAYDTRLGWQDWLAQHLVLRFNIGHRAAGRLIRDGRILPMVDGLDEMDPANSAPERAGALVLAVNASMRGLERAPVVVTCRRHEYEVLGRVVDRATHIEMIPLTGREAADYLRGQFLGRDEQDRWEQVLTMLDADPGGLLAGQLATPWRLTLALAVFRDRGSPTALLPQLAASASMTVAEYTLRVDRLLLADYVSRAVHLHDLARRYTTPQVQRWLTALASSLAWQATHSGSATDIQLDQWWRPTGRWAIRIVQITLTAGLITGAITWAATTGANNLKYHQGLPFIVGFSILIAFLTGIPFPPFQLKVRQIMTSASLGALAIGLAIGLAAGIGIVLTSKAKIGSGLLLGLGLGLAAGLMFGLNDNAPQAVGPRDVIRGNGQYGLTVGLATGLIVGLSGVLQAGLASGLASGLATGLAGGLALFGSVWIRYHITIMIIAVSQKGPLRFGVFLDWAQQAGLLRVSGVAYQFRHRQLQEWLTSYPVTTMVETAVQTQD
jgi:hypothetical protein